MKRVLPPVKIRRRIRRPNPKLPAPDKPRVDSGDEPEVLAGEVQGMKASSPEEFFADGLGESEAVDSFQFRYVVGAPRGLPGWKELDFLIQARGVYYAVEVDSEFTHRNKTGRGDVLHDAIVLNELRKQGMEVYPEVIHLQMETELYDREAARRAVKRLFS